MPLPLVVVAGAIAVKGVSFIWFASRATSPLSAPWRIEFLNHFEAELSTLEKTGGALPPQIASLKTDVALLRMHVAGGWGKAELFEAASRISYYRSWKHTVTGVVGIGGLFESYGKRAGEQVSTAIKTIFTSSSDGA